jgi:hypothetical protein
VCGVSRNLFEVYDVNAFGSKKTAAFLWGRKGQCLKIFPAKGFLASVAPFLWGQGSCVSRDHRVKLIFVAAAVLMGLQRRGHRFFWDKQVQCFWMTSGRSCLSALVVLLLGLSIWDN